jgi:16S rRNA (guanine527-N7)-methyltransferase
MTSAHDLAADREKALALTPVSRETVARLDRFATLLQERTQRTNLIGASTIPTLWTRHIADSLQLLPLAEGARTWVDLGSGAGFPGLVIACALADGPPARVHLIESVGKKAAFLREAVEVAGVPAIVHGVRIEEFAQQFSGTVDVVTARAVAPMVTLLALAYPLLKRGGRGLFLKGRDAERELTESFKSWNIDASQVPSKTSSQGRIVIVRRVAPRSVRK